MKMSVIRGLLLYLICIINLFVLAQTSEMDSLRKVINQSIDDTNKVFSYLKFGTFFQHDPNLYDSAYFYYNKAKILSRKLNYPEGEVAWANQLLSINKFFENLDSAEHFLIPYIDTCKKYNLEKGMAITMANLGSINSNKGNIIVSIEYYIQSAKYFELAKQKYNLAKALNNISRLYNQQSNPKALEYAEKSIATLIQLNDTIGIAYLAALSNKASALKYQQLEDSALFYFNKILTIAQSTKNNSQICSSLLDIADIEINRGNFDTAFELINKAKGYQELTQSTFSDFKINLMLANIYLKKNQLTLAQKYADAAFNQAKTIAISSFYVECYSTLADINAKKGNYQKAFEFNKQYIRINDSISNIEVKKNFAELEAKYQNEKKEREIVDKEFTIALQDAELKKKNAVLIAFIIIGILSLLFALFIMIYFRQKLIIKEKDIKALNHEKEKIVLLSQMEGQLKERDRISKEMHDDLGSMITTILFKTDTLKYQLKLAEELEAAQIIYNATSELADRLSEVIWAINPDNDTIESLGLHMRVTAAEMLDAAGIDFEFHFPEEYPDVEIGGDERRSIFLCMKEIVNNSIKHSLASKVTISLIINDNYLELCISDDGIGFDNSNRSKNGNGLKNLIKRADLLNGRCVIDSLNGTTIEMEFPIKIYKS